MQLWRILFVILCFSFHSFPVQESLPPLTIWIHGTKLFFSRYFFKDFFYNKIGLHHASTFDTKYHLRTIAQVLSETDPELFPFETFYFFGWDGQLSFNSRLNAGKSCYEEIVKLREDYFNRYGSYPYIRIITHSHGGNVALNVIRFKCADCNFIINELILLACPVQQDTAYLICDPFFEKIYSVFSRLDTIQIADPQKLHYWLEYYQTGQWKEHFDSPLFSERIFEPCDNLVQIKVSQNNKLLPTARGLLHVEFLLEPFLINLSSILHQASQECIKTDVPFVSIEF